VLQRDKENFDKLMNDSEKIAKTTADEVKAKTIEKQKLIKQIEELQAKITQKENKCKKHDDDLMVYKQNKQFLDILAIQAGKKKYEPKQKQSRLMSRGKSTEQGSTKGS